MSMLMSLSIVSHGHSAYIVRLLDQLAELGRSDFDVILTLNLPEELPIKLGQLPFHVRVVCNPQPKGFGANHNAAFLLSTGDNFVVMNPDIKLVNDPFPALLSMLDSSPHSIIAPLIVCNDGHIEDSARHFPSPYRLLKRCVSRLFKLRLAPDVVPQTEQMLMPDWVAGMFLLIPRVTYRLLHGFDETYFLYFEDVDFCARGRLAGCQILVNKQITVIHEAQRDSHRKLRYLLWHVRSAGKFFISSAYLEIQKQRLFGANRRLPSVR